MPLSLNFLPLGYGTWPTRSRCCVGATHHKEHAARCRKSYTGSFLGFFQLIPMSKSLKVYFTTAFLRQPLHMSSFKRPWASQNALALVRRIDSSESCGLLSGKSSVCTEVKPRSKPQRRYVRGAWLEPRSLSFPRNNRNKLRWLTKSHPAN